MNIKDFRDYEIIGRTRDDAVGEAFDKVARMLGLPYPGGPEISKLAEKSRIEKEKIGIEFPRPMIHSDNLDFSFSGLKTAVLYKLKSEKKLSEEIKKDVARAFEDAAVEVLVEKTNRALLELGSSIKTLIVAGGVSANIHLNRELEKLVEKFKNVKLHAPTRYLSTDNAVMIGIAAFIQAEKEPETIKKQLPIKARGNLSISSVPSR
mgnify:FL=1